MAGLKTPSKKRRDASKPSTVLIVFLVFFILLSIGLGVWGYYGYAGQEKFEKSAQAAKVSAKAKEDFANYAQYLSNEARLAIGAPGNPKDPILGADELIIYEDTRKKVLDENSAYKQEKSLEPFKKLLDAMKADLGPYDENAKRYPTSYREQFVRLKDELLKSQGLLKSTEDLLKATEDKILSLQTKQENDWVKTLALIQKGNAAALTASQTRTKAMEDQFAYNQKLNLEVEQSKKELGEEIENLKRKLTKLTMEAKQSAEKNDGGSANAKAGGELHALVLDVSRGKPLWDNPLGKITRVDLQDRQVYINLGSANGMKPEVTFNIFSAGPNKRADKVLKGTIEVIRVLDANSSLARITSIYDAEGREIVLGDPKRGRPGREAENALKEGDLLYNMFWGARVALAGNIQFAGQASDNPAEQMRIMADFGHFLNRQGMIVDAYLDLNDGQIKGAITSRTRYLIRGDDLVDPAAKPATKKKEVKEGEGDEKKDEAPKADVIPDRLKSVNDSAAKMRQEAADKGLMIISTDNFLNVIGYRQPRSAVYSEAAGFSPSAIMAGQPLQNPALQAAPAPKADEKAPEEKAPEKKDMKEPEAK